MPCATPVLLVEDNPTDALAIRRALLDSNAADAVTHIPCAREALAYLRSPGNNRPAMMLLDLNMPDADGLEFLRAVKSDPCLAGIPVVVLTSSRKPRDILKAFDLGIAGYMVKSTHYEKLLETVRTIRKYWSLSQFPTHHAGYGR